jgi:hypothetical protein
MGKKKAFIDKKSSTTYSLVFRSTEDGENCDEGDADGVLVPVEELGGGAGGAGPGPPSDPAALHAYFFGGDDYEEVCCLFCDVMPACLELLRNRALHTAGVCARNHCPGHTCRSPCTLLYAGYGTDQ